MDMGPFSGTEGSRHFWGAKERFDFDLWQKKGGKGVYVLVRRFRMKSNPLLEWVKHPPSEKVFVGFMVPIEHWDGRVNEEGTLI